MRLAVAWFGCPTGWVSLQGMCRLLCRRYTKRSGRGNARARRPWLTLRCKVWVLLISSAAMRRTAGALLAAAEQRAAERRRREAERRTAEQARREREQAVARGAYLENLRGREPE